MTDRDLISLLERAADQAPAPDGAVVDAGVCRGVALRRRRRGAAVGGVAAVVTVAVVGAVALGSAEPGRPAGPAPGASVAADPSVPPASPTSEPAATPTEKWTPPPRGSRQDVDVFTDVVGGVVGGVGELTGVYSYDYGHGGIRSVHATLTDDVGPAHLNVAVTTEDPNASGVYQLRCGSKRVRTLDDCEQVPPPVVGLSCDDGAFVEWECRQLADGTVVRWGEERTYEDARDRGEYSNSVVVHRPDGLLVNAYVFNSGGEKTAVTRDAPPLGFAAMREIALDPRWSDVDLRG